MKSPTERAVILLSGGLDSATVLAEATEQGYRCYALSFQYGQRHQAELQAAQKIASHFQVAKHLIIPLDLSILGGSALTSNIEVPKHHSVDQIEQGIPVTYVPARNTIFLSYALAWAEVLQTGNLFIGVNALDYSGYPDCRPEYVNAFTKMANLATKGAVEGSLPIQIHTPLLHLTKQQIIAKGLRLGVDYQLTTSCYDPPEIDLACGACDACLLRLRGFAENGIEDPIRYQNQP